MTEQFFTPNNGTAEQMIRQAAVQETMKICDGMRYYKKTFEQNNMVCMKIECVDPIDPECLQYALENTLKRLRVFRLTVEHDAQVFYLKELTQPPVVQADHGQRRTVCTPENHGYMLRVSYCGNTITIDFFHGISDGMGIIAFQKLLMYLYVERKYGGSVCPPPDMIAPDTPEDTREYADSLTFVSDMPVAAPSKQYDYERAFQLPDLHMESKHLCAMYQLKVNADKFEQYMRANETSRSAMFTMFMNRVIAEQNNTHELPVVAALAANARKAYGAEKTLQCCIATIPIWYDAQLRELPWHEQLKAGRNMISDGVRPERILHSAQGIKRFNRMLEDRFPTLEEKKAYAREVNRQGGVKYTYGISYIGELDYGRDINRYIASNYPILSANTIPIIIEIAKWNRHYYLSYCTHLENDPYVQKLQDLFVSEGIPCICSPREIFEEAYADF